MHYVTCIYIDYEANYFMILIMFKSLKQPVTNSVFIGKSIQTIFHKQIYI